MGNDFDPIIGNWYQDLDKKQLFQVVALDETGTLVEIQYFDGNIAEFDLPAWRIMNLELAEEPEDWSGALGVEEDEEGEVA